jgi:hypothetical protein
MKCFQCQGPWHPATGHVLATETVLCGPCAQRFFRWMRAHMARRWGGHDFYVEAATSIRAGVFPRDAGDGEERGDEVPVGLAHRSATPAGARAPREFDSLRLLEARPNPDERW